MARRSRQELKELLVKTGLEILFEDGLGTGAETLTFKRVFDRVEEEEGFRVSNASVIGRIWGDMSEFQADVLVAAVSDENEQEIAEMLTAVEPVFRSADRSSIEGRQWALGELTRVAGDTHFDKPRALEDLATLRGDLGPGCIPSGVGAQCRRHLGCRDHL